MSESRPDPDALLAKIKADDVVHTPGRLKIFFGAVAGVGKTFAMLESARQRQAQGLPVLVGWVDTHGRRDTEALLAGLPQLPPASIEYRGRSFSEFDLDQALERRPPLILVDELAHTNIPGSRHSKRWQDVQELLAAGVDVWTTLNVQHIESISDIVREITSVRVRETLPDSIFEDADEVELIDLPPDELLVRLDEGKVYLPESAEIAREEFFRKGNLIALRELALRATASRVDAQMQVYRRAEARERTWPVAERLMVCISSSPSAQNLVRAGRRMAAGLRAEWMVVWVETPRQQQLRGKDREYAPEALRLAESLGAEAVTLDGQDATQEMLAYARRRNVTRILVGKPGTFWLRDRIFGSVVDELVRESGEIDVVVVTVEEQRTGGISAQERKKRIAWAAYVGAVATVGGATMIAHLMVPRFSPSNLIMIYLLGVVIAATRWGRGAAALATVLSVAAFDYFFVPPFLSFAVSDTQFVVTFGVMLVVALMISTLTSQVRDQARAARQREQEMVALYALSRELTSVRGSGSLAATAVRQVDQAIGLKAEVFLPDKDGRIEPVTGTGQSWVRDPHEKGVAFWAYRQGLRAGWGTDTLPEAHALYLPLATARGTIGVLGVRRSEKQTVLRPDQVHLLEAFSNQLALGLERERLAEETEQAKMRIEAERLQNALLSSVSHDFRTPLAVITGAASSIVETGSQLDPAAREDLARTIFEEADRLGRLISNLLEMTRLSSGAVDLRVEWHSLEEIVGSTLSRLDRRLVGRTVQLEIPEDLPLIAADGLLLEQLLVNLVENAVRYSPAGSPLELSARRAGEQIEVEIRDRGPGLAPGEETLVFEKFFRGSAGRDARGAGLGLAICRAVVEAHGGTIEAQNREGGGAVFRFHLPVGEPPR